MTNSNIINIHGKEYVPVASRVQMAHQSGKPLSIVTEVLTHEPVLVKATVTTDKGTFTGLSAANPLKTIEKQSPYEVAETSAVGRALGFAGFGSMDSIATADEMLKAGTGTESTQTETARATATRQPQPNGKAVPLAPADKPAEPASAKPSAANDDYMCALHRIQMKPRTSTRGQPYHDHRKQGRLVNGTVIPDPNGEWYWCQGHGYHVSLASVARMS